MLDAANFVLGTFGGIFIGAALLMGMVIMVLGGLRIFCSILDRLIERILRSMEIYREFLAFAKPRVMARASRRLGR